MAQALSSRYDLNFQKFDLLQLHNGLASLYSHLPGKLASVWMELGLDPQKIYEMLSLRYGAEYVTHLGCVVEWFKYVKLYSAVHSKCALGLEEAVKLLVLKQDTKASRAWVEFFEKSKNDEYNKFAKTLRKLYDEMLEKESKSFSRTRGRRKRADPSGW